MHSMRSRKCTLLSTAFGILHSVIFCAVCLLASGCTIDRIDRGLTYGGSKNPRANINDIRIEILLTDESDKPIPAVTISGETPHSKESAITNAQGIARVSLSVAEEDAIDFHFKSIQRKIEGTRSLVSYPRNQPQLRIVFKADAGGRVRLTQLEY